jgi:hypothetical protein
VSVCRTLIFFKVKKVSFFPHAAALLMQPPEKSPFLQFSCELGLNPGKHLQGNLLYRLQLPKFPQALSTLHLSPRPNHCKDQFVFTSKLQYCSSPSTSNLILELLIFERDRVVFVVDGVIMLIFDFVGGTFLVKFDRKYAILSGILSELKKSLESPLVQCFI